MPQVLPQPWVATLTAVSSRAEQKAIDGAHILAEYLNLKPVVVAALGEIDRSSTGYLPAGNMRRWLTPSLPIRLARRVAVVA
jgi:hypothetical protein